jgi:hypothetical protein
MTPREAEELTAAEYRAFVAYANNEIRAANRAARKRR